MNDLVTRVSTCASLLSCAPSIGPQRLPAEMENLLLRPEFSNKLSQALANNLSVIIDRQVKEAVSQVVLPEIHAIKNELSRWQTEAQRSQEVKSILCDVGAVLINFRRPSRNSSEQCESFLIKSSS